MISGTFQKVCTNDLRGVAQFGRALGSGLRGRAFESRHPEFKSIRENKIRTVKDKL